jgi:hypothetical protein
VLNHHDASFPEELGPPDNTLLIADLGLEGGGLAIHGKRSELGWISWAEGTTIALDENDDETWKSWSSEPTADLARLLPADWTMFYPLATDPAFRSWFRQAYDTSRRSLPPELRRVQEVDRHGCWLEILGDEAAHRSDR